MTSLPFPAAQASGLRRWCLLLFDPSLLAPYAFVWLTKWIPPRFCKRIFSIVPLYVCNNISANVDIETSRNGGRMYYVALEEPLLMLSFKLSKSTSCRTGADGRFRGLRCILMPLTRSHFDTQSRNSFEGWESRLGGLSTCDW